MTTLDLPARFTELSLPPETRQDASVAIPTVRGTWWLKYGRHTYYFLNLATSKGLRVDIPHRAILGAGLARFARCAEGHGRSGAQAVGSASVLRLLPRRFHYGFGFPAQMALMTVPHAVTSLGQGRFLVNLWSWFGFVSIDCRNRTATYHLLDVDPADEHVLGSQQWADPVDGATWFMSYSLRDSLRRVEEPAFHDVSSRIMKRDNDTGGVSEVWSGAFSDYMHDLLVNETRRYAVACELGMFVGDDGEIIPSRVLVLDLDTGRHWVISRFVVAAHAELDPDEPDVVYFSNHNFRFEPTGLWKLLRSAAFDIDFKGPASVYKYRLTPDGPKELGEFSHPDMFRLTNTRTVRHRGRKLLVSIGSPNYLFVADAEDMTFVRKIAVTRGGRPGGHADVVGTFSPSLDGERLYVQTNRSFQVLDVATGEPVWVRDASYSHSCSNHMLTASDTSW